MSANWWLTAWVEKIQKLAESQRLVQGAELARTKQLQHCRRDGRTLIAAVQARGEPSFTVRITFGAFEQEQWEQLFANIRDWRALAGSLAAFDLPLEMQTAFAKAKLRFMPERYADLHLECGCTDWLKPCKHLVAAWLKFGNDFERDPLLLFELRGMERAQLFALLRGAVQESVAEPEPEEEIEVEPVPIHLQPLPTDPAAFWAAPPLPPDLPAGERRLLDDDVFERLGSPELTNWQAAEPQLHRIYDAVFEYASILLRK
jgi:uncharacterized Zn finger protein